MTPGQSWPQEKCARDLKGGSEAAYTKFEIIASKVSLLRMHVVANEPVSFSGGGGAAAGPADPPAPARSSSPSAPLSLGPDTGAEQ